MLELISERRPMYLTFALWVILGKYAPSIAQALIPLTVVYYMAQKMELELFISMLLVIIISDNYYTWWIAPIKPIILILLFLYTTFNAEISPFRNFSKAFFLFFLFGMCLWPLSDYIGISVQKFIAYMLMFITIPSLIHSIYRNQGYQVFKHVVVFLFLGVAISYLYRFLDPHLAYSHGGRLRGTFGNPNGLGMFVFFSLMFFEITKSKLNFTYSKIENWAIYVLFGLTLLATGSRGAMVGSGLFYLFRRLGKQSIFLSLVILALIVLFFQFFLNDLVYFLIDLGLGDALRLSSDEAQSIETGSGRLVAWNFAWEQIQKDFFFGKAWAHEEQLFHTEHIQLMLNALNHEGGAHNSYLIFWMNTGLIGMILFFIPLIRVFLKAYEINKDVLPFLYGALFLATFEPWLAGSLNPYTITMLAILGIVYYVNEDNSHIEEPETDLAVVADSDTDNIN